MSELSIPTNIKQVGEIPDGIQIYLEDYVYTYLYQYARKDTKSEQLAVLIGKYEKREEEEIVLISGAIQVKDPEVEKGQPHFTEEAWEYVQEKQKEYFPETQVLGWMHTQPGYGLVMTSFHHKEHEKWFKMPYQLIYVIDPIGKLDHFYRWREGFRDVSGYFIYYDRNEEMHDYMLDHRVIKNKILEQPEDVIVQYRKQDRYRRQEAQQKKIIHMLTSFSAVLLFICLIMGIGLIYNVEQVQQLQEALNTMDSTYTNLFTQIKGDAIEGVFAQEIEVDDGAEEDMEMVVVQEKTEKNLEDIQKSAEQEVQKNKEEEIEKSQEEQEVEKEEELQNEEQEVVVKEYTIQKGDNLNKISYQFYQTTDMVDEILVLNGITDPDKIYAGKTIMLP